ncbi:urocortin [Emys orbicularis]|uniref:urocortin n=1 Tax=Emys orbicularis TaxID=82168 RepID=UPI0031FC51CE
MELPALYKHPASRRLSALGTDRTGLTPHGTTRSRTLPGMRRALLTALLVSLLLSPLRSAGPRSSAEAAPRPSRSLRGPAPRPAPAPLLRALRPVGGLARARREEPPLSIDLTFHLLRHMLDVARAQSQRAQAEQNRLIFDAVGK